MSSEVVHSRTRRGAEGSISGEARGRGRGGRGQWAPEGQADPALYLAASRAGEPRLPHQLVFQKKPETRIFTKHNVCQVKFIPQPKAT